MFVVPRSGERWELRESTLTAAGPRSRTLATFRQLDSDTITHAARRSRHPVDADALKGLCRRAGAPVSADRADRASGALLSALADGQHPRPALARVLSAELSPSSALASDSERAAARWITATAAERGATLRDLLTLADRLPARKHAPLKYPAPKPPR